MSRRLVTTATMLLLLVATAVSPAAAADTSASPSPVTVTAGGYVRGGDPFRTAAGTRCAVGFTVTKTGFKGFLTAGHCGTAGQAVYTPAGELMGHFTAASYPGNSFGLVQLTPAWIPLGVVRTGATTTAPVKGSTAAPIGSPVCRFGDTTGWKCGVVHAINQTVNYADGSVHGLTRTSICTPPGDSVGPVVAGTQAQGLHVGGTGNCTAGGTSFFQPVNEALLVYGLSLITS
jgi:streptogrisin C